MSKRKLSSDIAFLELLADSFCDEIARGGESFLIHLAAADDGHDVGVKPLEGAHPADALLGTVAPDEWWALGVASGGWARPLDADGRPGERSDRVATALVVTRDGKIVSRLRMGNKTLTDPPGFGAILDTVQRSLGLPCAPPAARTGQLFATTWLENVIPVGAEQQRAGKPLCWADACLLHPVFKVFRSHEDGYRPTDVEIAALAMERVCDWERLRWLVVEGAWPSCNISGTQAAWFDAGSFSRWVLSDHLTLSALLDEVDHAAGTGIAKRCARVLERLNLMARNEWRPAAA